MAEETTTTNLLAGIEFDDPRLYDLLSILIRDFYALNRQINPPTTRSFGETGQLGSSGLVTGFTATLYGNNLHISWAATSGAFEYILKYHLGTSTDWATGNTLLTTTGLSADINPVTVPLVVGTHTFLLKGKTSSGVESLAAAVLTITINTIEAPVISPTIIDNNVLLNWTAPASQLNISYYNVYKNSLFLGTMAGTFEAIFETVAGTYLYGVEAVDIVGNIGTRGSILAIVNQPPDYELQDSRTSDLLGSRVHVAYELLGTTPRLVANVDICTDYIINLMPQFTPIMNNPERIKRRIQTVQEDRKI